LLGEPHRKASVQKELTQFDEELRKHFERMENAQFDREDRLATLENHGFDPAANSIFGAIFQELRNKAKQDKLERRSLESHSGFFQDKKGGR
jgi:hypothetical protein